MKSICRCLLALVFPLSTMAAHPHCLADSGLRTEFEGLLGGFEIPRPGSCCMQDVCGLACPVELEPPASGFGVAVTVFMIVSVGLGIVYARLFLEADAIQFFVAGRSLPLAVATITLAAQSLDSNALLGNVDLSFKYSFWDGAVIPIGLAGSLVLNGIFLASKIHDDNALTLVDVFAKRYGKTVEVLVGMCSITSFLMLLAGNLVGSGRIISYVWGVPKTTGIWLSMAFVWLYTYCGGLLSVAYTDVIQGVLGWTGCFVVAMYLLISHEIQAPEPSIGFPGYIYPDNVGDGGICDMHRGVACLFDPSKCCYNEELWCPDGGFNCTRYDRGAYPTGDYQIYNDQMTNSNALEPFPNAIVFNWATLIILAFGNLGALDFQARAMASNSAKNARISCFLAASLTIMIGLPFSFLGSIVRIYFGPDSVRGYLEPDSCAVQLGLATCAQWVPDNLAFIKFLTHDVPGILGGWALLGIVAASMSTADGAIHAIGTTFSHNIFRHLEICFPNVITKDNLLHMARVTTLIFSLLSGGIAVFYNKSSHAAGATGYLLIVAFDVMFATSVVPLFGCFYCKNPSPRAALLSVLFGGGSRLLLEILLPKDGSLLAPFGSDNFLNVGSAASSLLPGFVDADLEDIWDPTEEICGQTRFKDFTGIDSLVSPLIALVVFVSIQTIESYFDTELFWFPGSKGYEKDTEEEKQVAGSQ